MFKEVLVEFVHDMTYIIPTALFIVAVVVVTGCTVSKKFRKWITTED